MKLRLAKAPGPPDRGLSIGSAIFNADPDPEAVIVVDDTPAGRRLALLALEHTLWLHDATTPRHCRRVRRHVLRLARTLRLPGRQRRALALAARFHDLGKVGIPLATLLKPGRLTAEEYRTVCEHPALGERLLATFISSTAVLAAVRGHHERFDGGGYPDGLGGHDIPLLARIISVADAYDAMTGPRPYRQQPMRAEDALQQLRVSTGQFDPTIVLAFTELCMARAGRQPQK
jgi:HD-GYP domain-containing protein (c-di-GMP phosphodiesterase class II)